MNSENKGFATSAAPSKTWVIVGTVSSALLLAAIAYIAVLNFRYAELESSSRKAIDAHLQTILLQTQQVDALDQLAVRVDRFNREFGASLGRLQMNESLEKNVAELKARVHLPDEAKKTLAEFEQSLAAVQEMSAKMKEFERYLGAPAAIKRGDSHSAIARAYLLNEAKLTPQEADKVMRRTALDWELEPGNLVFNLYHEGTLLTTVTQGTAKHAPLMVQWMRRQAAANRVAELEEKLKACEARPVGNAPTGAIPEARPSEGAAAAAAPATP
jgi:Skp family chaperone for outer membrane proteins